MREKEEPMLKGHSLAAAVLVALVSAAAAEDVEKWLPEAKKTHTETLILLFSVPTGTRRTPGYRALREDWIKGRDMLRELEGGPFERDQRWRSEPAA
jgi:hypothetical protein